MKAEFERTIEFTPKIECAEDPYWVRQADFYIKLNFIKEGLERAQLADDSQGIKDHSHWLTEIGWQILENNLN